MLGRNYYTILIPPGHDLLVKEIGEIQKIELLLRCVTTSLSLRNYLPPLDMICKRVTTNISSTYNGTHKTFVINCVLHKTKLNLKISSNFSILSYYNI
jgi:hypothetical protein